MDYNLSPKASTLFLYDTYEESFKAFTTFVKVNQGMLEKCVPQVPYVQVGALRIYFGYASSRENFMNQFAGVQCAFIVYNGTNDEVRETCRCRVRATTKQMNYLKGINND